MKPPTPLAAGFLLALLTASGLRAQDEPSPEIAGLQQAAADFVLAYNAKDPAAIAALFTENGEMSDLRAADTTTGRVDIQLRYAEIFAAGDTPSVAVAVDSVRFVGKDLAIEDGTVHFTPHGENAPAKSTAYTAVLQKNGAGVWQQREPPQHRPQPARHPARQPAQLELQPVGRQQGRLGQQREPRQRRQHQDQ